LTSEGTTIEANAVDGLATHGGLLYAYNDANELWSLDVAGGATEWILSDFPLLPVRCAICLDTMHLPGRNPFPPQPVSPSASTAAAARPAVH
jgi:hypothetical protein